MLQSSKHHRRDTVNRPKPTIPLFTKIKATSAFQKFIVVFSLTILIISLTQPAFYIDRKDFDAYSSSPYLFFLGWMGFLGGSTECFIWLANPIYFIGLYLFISGKRLSIATSASATFLALLFAMLPTILTSESGARSKVTSLELGYKLWVSSFGILFMGNIVNRIIKRDVDK